MGPMPHVERLALTVLQTYSDGKVRRWPSSSSAQEGAGPVLVLIPATAPADAAVQAPGPSAASADDGSGLQGNATLGLTLTVGLAIGLLSGLVLARRVRGKRPAPEEEAPLEPPDEEAAQQADLDSTRPRI
jgi:hypothetical protein